MKKQSIALIILAISAVINTASAQEEKDFEKYLALTKEFSKLNTCAAYFRRLGGSENEEKARIALEKAKKIAPSFGFNTDEEINGIYQDHKKAMDSFGSEEMRFNERFCSSKQQ